MTDSEIPKWNLWARLDPRLRPIILIFLIITTCYALVFNSPYQTDDENKTPLYPDLPYHDLASIRQGMASRSQELFDQIFNRPIVTNGLVFDTGQDMFSPPYLLLADQTNADAPVLRCEFNVAYKNTLYKLEKGQTVTVSGTWRGQMDDHGPVFVSCGLR